jgi:hypothetical protein
MFLVRASVRAQKGDIMIRRKILAALPLIGALTVAQHAQATTVNFFLSGDGNVTASGSLTIGPDPYSGAAFGTPANLISVPGGPPINRACTTRSALRRSRAPPEPFPTPRSASPTSQSPD